MRLGCTPSWWQWLKAFREAGHQVIVTPYVGDVPSTPWWDARPNPLRLESALAKAATDSASGRAAANSPLAQIYAARRVRPAWRKHLERILEEEGDVDVVLLLNIPPHHIQGIPSHLQDRYGVKVAMYDGDMPTILPEHVAERGFRFAPYDDVDLGEYDLVACNSEGCLDALRDRNASNVAAIHYAADPDLYAPQRLPHEWDVAFYGHGDDLRRQWMTRLLVEPSKALPHHRFVIGGGGFTIDLGRVEPLGRVPIHAYPGWVARGKVHLNITRTSHTNVHASSTARPFELAAMGACIVSQPYEGMEQWFRPVTEVQMVEEGDDCTAALRGLLDDDERQQTMRTSVRRAVVERHTWRHRVDELVASL